jgi:arylsulfatase A-like enzyme
MSKILLSSLLGLTIALSLSVAQAADRPNVLVLFSDDQGSIDLNCYGAKDLSTPHLDGLARRGVRFTQFYSAAPVCSPSRAGLLTGRAPQRAGQAGNASSSEGTPGMPTEQVTMAELFKQAGYATGHFGKWHLGFTPETMPQGQGFDHSFGHMGGCIDNYSHFFYWNGPNRHDLWRNGEQVWQDGEYFPNLVTREFGEWVGEQKRPWFAYVAINLPHYPLQGRPKYREHYADLPSPRADYAACVSTVDDVAGSLLAKLDALGIRENTIVVFQSDHGHSTEDRTFGTGGNSGPYRGAKFSLFEGGIRVPAIISWPGHLPEDTVRASMATGCDWLPTLVELAGLEPVKHTIDGKSLATVLTQPEAATPHETFVWESGRGAKGPQWAVRRGDWKLIGNPRDTSEPDRKLPLHPQRDARFLVNLSQDIGETKNLAADHPDVVAEMEAIYEKWKKDVQDQSVKAAE